MKTNRKSTVSKLVAKFDNELRDLLMNDLKTLKEAKNNFFNNMKSDSLSAA